MSETRMLSALLKHHRGARGMSQLDLAGAAGISAKHLSFLETGRARPSREMILRLGATLALSLRDQNALLLAAGFSESFAESEIVSLPAPIHRALERIMAVHEPYPVVVFDGQYDVRMMNHGASALLALILPSAKRMDTLNVLALCFDPEGLRPYLENWEHVARFLLCRVAHEHLKTGRDALARLLSRLLAYPDVPSDFHALDYEGMQEPVFELHLRYQGQRLSFLTTLTSFSSPRDVTLEELRIETYYPVDEASEQLCRQLVAPR